MADYNAISEVSQALKHLLEKRMAKPHDLTVTIAPPDKSISNVNGYRLNLYLYQITEDGSMKNQDLPNRGHSGTYGQPPLSLVLHYLLTVLSKNEGDGGSETEECEAQEILGDAMAVLNDNAIFTREIHLPGDTVNSRDRIRVSLQPMTLDEFSKIWTALPKANFRLSVAYSVSLVQIESRKPRQYPPPVREPKTGGPKVYAIPFIHPFIQAILVRRYDDHLQRERPYPYARITDKLCIVGGNFPLKEASLIIGGVEFLIGNEKGTAILKVEEFSSDRIVVTIPDDPSLQPGPVPVQIIIKVDMGDPLQPHTGFKSNTAVFLLVPDIKEIIKEVTPPPGSVTIKGSRLYQEGVDCLTLIGDIIIHSGSYSTAGSGEIKFNLPDNLSSGQYPVRVRVNGMESINQQEITIT